MYLFLSYFPPHFMKILSFDVGTKNLAFCILDEQTITHWNVIDVKCKSSDDICSRIVDTLDEYPDLLLADLVLIEKQPSKNNKMRIVEALLNAYFVIKGVNNPSSLISKVLVYSSKHKLGSTNLRGSLNYRERKKLGMTRCQEFLTRSSQPDQFISLYSSSKKKDDLADCLLQALSYTKDDTLHTIEAIDLDTSCKIVARKATKKQEAKMYSKSNLKFIFLQHSSSDSLNSLIDSSPKVRKALSHWYPAGGISKALREFSISYST